MATSFVHVHEPLSTLVEVPYHTDLRRLCGHLLVVSLLIWFVLAGLRLIRAPLVKPDMPGKQFNAKKYYQQRQIFGPRCT